MNFFCVHWPVGCSGFRIGTQYAIYRSSRLSVVIFTVMTLFNIRIIIIDCYLYYKNIIATRKNKKVLKVKTFFRGFPNLASPSFKITPHDHDYIWLFRRGQRFRCIVYRNAFSNKHTITIYRTLFVDIK